MVGSGVARAGSTTHQIYTRDIQPYRHQSIANPNPPSYALKLLPSNTPPFAAQQHHRNHPGTARCEIVQTDQGVHLVLPVVQQPLYQRESVGFEDKSTGLKQKSRNLDFDFSEGGKHHSKNDYEQVETRVNGKPGQAKRAESKENKDRGGALDSKREY